jgi:RNA-directed DNA polymerase
MWKVAKEGGLGNLATPPSVRKLQTALHAKAKAEPEFRFYLLYDKVYRADVLSFAYARCKANGGAAGVDGQTFEDIEAYGSQVRESEGRETQDIDTDWNPWLGELAQELRNKTYRPQAVRRVYIPKPNSKKMRPLGIATIRDRVVQTAAMLVLEPIFEADLQPEQYAYRAGKNALDAVEAVNRLINFGHTAVVDADLRGYRRDTARTTDEIGGAPDLRPADPASGQDVDRGAGGGDGRSRTQASNHAQSG